MKRFFQRIPKTTYDITLDSQRNCKKNRKENALGKEKSDGRESWDW